MIKRKGNYKVFHFSFFSSFSLLRVKEKELLPYYFTVSIVRQGYDIVEWNGKW
jgi:hypothetical protein